MTHAATSGGQPSRPASVLVAAICWYQRWISPYLGNRCRFHPSCSTYARTAIEVHGTARGSWLALLRLMKCQPFHPGGFDDVPPKIGRVVGQHSGYGETVSTGHPERGSS